MSGTAVELQHALETRIRHELPSLSESEATDLARSVARLVAAFDPESIYVFGSRARNDANEDSDVDLMVVVSDSDQPSYVRAQHARFAIDRHLVPVDILVWTRAEFLQRVRNPASLSATVLQEGMKLYAAVPG